MDEGAVKKFEFQLSLTGYLLLQEKKEKKGRLISKKGSHRYWFWFDEKDCSLKYYKNQDSYKQYLHNPVGVIDMENAKVTPAAVHSSAVESDPNTFIITTSANLHYALTAENDGICHAWIKKLQVKRGEWIKKEKNPRTMPRAVSPRINTGLVGDPGFGLSLGNDYSRSVSAGGSTCSPKVRKIFYDQLESKQSFGYQDPFEHLHTVRTDSTVSAPAASSSTTECSDMPDSAGTKPSSGSVDSDESLKSSEEFNNSARPLTEHEKIIIQLKCELGESRQERDQLQKQVLNLQEKLKRKEKEAQSLKDETEKLKETLFNIGSPKVNFVMETENLKSIIDQLQSSLKSLDGEVELHKLNLKERDKEIASKKQKIADLQSERMALKAKYVTLLSSSFKISTPTPAGLSGGDDLDNSEDKLKEELFRLIKEESTDTDITTESQFEDQYGELHDWRGDSNIYHFLCRQLYLHFTEPDQESLCSVWNRYLDGLKKVKDRYYEIPTDRSRKREMRTYLRRGIPTEFRSQVWSSLIHHHVGKRREIQDSTVRKGNYYQSLCEQTSDYIKQIHLDLYRTLPNNKHFKQGGDGGEKLQRVLVAYSNHNKNIGYCQGMNMIAATGLMFLDEETAFWYLVVIMEKLMPPNYYSNGLAAAQADQVVLKHFIQEKLSQLNDHFESNLIDVTVVTFNWFLTLFIDALPTESMLRIMDCFLLEGRKVLFRFSLAILKLYERRILSIVDPVTIFQFVKKAVKHVFNVEELFQIAFAGLESFPSRSSINSHAHQHIGKFLEEWNQRNKQRNEYRLSVVPKTPSPPTRSPSQKKTRKQLQWECACVINENEIWLSCGERQVGKVCIVKASDDGFDVVSPSLNVGSRILCIKTIPNDIVMMGTLDFTIHAVSALTRKELWSRKMNDSILDFVSFGNNLLCALADGYLASLPTSGITPPNSDPLLYRIGNTAVQCLVCTHLEHIWCACEKAITVICARTHEPIKPLVMSDNEGRVYRMELGDHGVWVTFRSSTMVCLYDTVYMIKLLQVDYPQLLETPGTFNKSDHRIIVVTPVGNQLWLGTGNATIFIFSIESAVTSPIDSIQQIAQQVKEGDTEIERSLRNRPLSDEGLVNAPARKLGGDRYSSDGASRLDRGTFGKTFRRRARGEAPQEKEQVKVYELSHLSSSRVLPDSLECSRVTVLKPIKRMGQQFVISCVNSTSMVEKAVQLWQCSSSVSPANWNYTCLPDCYESVTKDLQLTSSYSQSTTAAQYADRGRTYSTILGLPAYQSTNDDQA